MSGGKQAFRSGNGLKCIKTFSLLSEALSTQNASYRARACRRLGISGRDAFRRAIELIRAGHILDTFKEGT